MARPRAAVTTAMAKTQKTLFLSPDLCRLVQECADRLGTTFSKVVTAAVIERVFAQPKPPRPVWMALAVALEKQTLPLSEIPIALHEEGIRQEEALIAQYKSEEGTDSAVDHCEANIAFQKARMAQWKHLVQFGGGGTDGVIAAAIQLQGLQTWNKVEPIPDTDRAKADGE